MTDGPQTLTYAAEGPIARITLDRPERGNGITLGMPRELEACVERADLDPSVHVIALAGNGSGFCGGYDLVAGAERLSSEGALSAAAPETGGPQSRRPRSPRAPRSTPPRSPATTTPTGPGTRSPTTR